MQSDHKTRHYAYLKPVKGEAPFYLLITLAHDEKRLKLFYSQSWYKSEHVEKGYLEHWRSNLQSLLPIFSRVNPHRTPRHFIKAKANSCRVKGTCFLKSTLFKDILGFSHKSVPKVFSAKMQGLVSLVDPRLIEMTIELNYAELGSLITLCEKLSIFTTDPNAETVQKRLTFFDMKHVVDAIESVESIDDMKSDVMQNTSTVTDSSESDGKHEKTERTGTGPESGHRIADLEKTFEVDDQFSTGQHPYGSVDSSGQVESV